MRGLPKWSNRHPEQMSHSLFSFDLCHELRITNHAHKDQEEEGEEEKEETKLQSEIMIIAFELRKWKLG